MRILFYEDPVTDQNAFLWRAPHIVKDAAWMAALADGGCDVRMVLNSAMLPIAQKADCPVNVLITVQERAIVAALPGPQLNINTLFQRWADELAVEDRCTLALSDSTELRLAMQARDVLIDALTPHVVDFQPDVIITWVPIPHMRRMFPDALILHKETSLLSRAPLPLTYYLDPRGFGRNALLGRGYPIRVEQDVLDHQQQLREILDEAMSIAENVSDLLESLSGFEATILVAGHTNNVFFFDGACDYRSQVHLIIDVLDHAPKTWAVVATEHPDCVRLTDAEVAYLKGRYANFLHWPQLRSRPGSSQSLARHFDAVATVSSSVGAQAVLWGKRLYAYGRSHLNRFDLGEPLSAFSSSPVSLLEPEAAAWLCFHYSYQDSQVAHPGWLAAHLRMRLEHWRTNGLEGYFDAPLREPAEMLSTYRAELVAKSRAGGFAELPVTWKPHRLNMRAAGTFPAGWGAPEGDDVRAYRWTLAKDAELRIFIDRTREWTISLTLGSLPHDEVQTASLFIGAAELARIDIPNGAVVELKAALPSELIGELSTTLHLRATCISRPDAEIRDLALGVSNITLRASAPMVESIALFEGESVDAQAEMEQTLDRLVKCVQEALVDDMPDDNIYIENVFPSPVYDQILSNLPPDSAYDFIEHPDAVRSDGTKTRMLLDLTPETLSRLNDGSREFWRRMIKVLTSPALQHAITAKFGERIADQHGARWPEMVTVPVLYRDFTGYRISIHPDADFKIATMQFYFPVDDAQIHLGTSFHTKGEDGFVELKTNAFKPNSAYAFVRSPKSWHSVKEIEDTNVVRNTLALTIYIKGREYKSADRKAEYL